jgi:hypothetical protein
VSCRNESQGEVKDASPYFTNFFAKDDKGVLRGISFGMTQEEIKKMEKAKLFESTADHLFYEFSYPKDSTNFGEYANVQYFFDENSRLDIITADIFLNDSIQENKLKTSLVQYFNSQYGTSKSDDYDYDVWKGKTDVKNSGEKANFSVALKGLDDDYGVKLEYMKE